jgi:DNA polymerase (family 10)
VTTNAEIADRLEEMGDLLEAKDVDFKPRAYRRAAETIRGQPTPVGEIVEAGGEEALQELEHVGEAIASKVVEYVETGEIEELEDLRADLPVEMAALTRVEGVGPKTVGTLYEALGIETLDDLETAAEAGEIQDVSGFGAKTEQNILDGIEFARQSRERQLLGDARPLADEALEYLREVDAAERWEVAGSIRRWRATIGDVDVLVATEDPDAVVAAFTDWDRVEDVIEAGTTKASTRVAGVRIDLRTVVPDEFGSALQYFTGSKDHNITLRNYAIDREVKLNEYGAFDVSAIDDPDAGQRVGDRIGGETEESMYAALDLPWMPPELREDRGEIEAAAADELPDLIAEGDVRGDLHTHTDWSDGDETIEELARGAIEYGHEYLCISDHATGPGMVGGVGLEDDELRDQMTEVRTVDDDLDGIDLLTGVEANVDAEGGVSVADDVLAELDLVVASPHSALDQGSDAATDRLVAAVEHPHVDVLGHPSGRLLNRREGLSFDVDAVVEAAVDAGTALEINANPYRLDLWGSAVQTAVDAGATIAINTDAHHHDELPNVRYGVHTARRGWAEADDVLNTRPIEDVRTFVED